MYKRQRWKRLLAGILVLFLALLAATWFISWQRLESERELVNRNSRVRQESLASIIAENLAQVLERGRLLALASAEWFEGDRQDATNRLLAMLSTDRAFLRIALYDLDQRRVFSSSPGADSGDHGVAIQAILKNRIGNKPAILEVVPLSRAY